MASVRKAIKIFARIKPSDVSFCPYELDKHINDDGSTDDILLLNSSSTMNVINNNYLEDMQSSSSLNKSASDAYKFRFSKVFSETCSQVDIFDVICQPVLEKAIEGYNGTIFAYGQTGSGKTFTMTGQRNRWENRGIIPRALEYIFRKFDSLTEEGYIASATLSYLEIYNENGYDLLQSSFSTGRFEDMKKVQLLEDAQQQFHMRNLTTHPIKTVDEAMALLYTGDRNRMISETPMNEVSTRSHCIFTIYLNVRAGASSTVRRSKVHLVDLAGSERLGNSQSTGQLFNEARHINLALHYLEQVIVALGESHRSHIPYRNSMMTSILRDSLGGNCMTSMVATLSLEHRNIMETLSTCRFSQRVALVTNAAVLNEEMDPMLLISQLKTENKRLKEIIANSSIKTGDSSVEPLSPEDYAECMKLVEKYVSDGDEESYLPVAPDMRIIQVCFQCLKTAAQMKKDSLLEVSPAMAAMAGTFKQGKGSSFMPQFPDKAKTYDEGMTKEELIECLRIRDAEIGVLKTLMTTSGNSNRRKKSSFLHLTVPSQGTPSSHFEYGDGLQAQSGGATIAERPYSGDADSDDQKMCIHHPQRHENEHESLEQADSNVFSIANFLESNERSDQSTPADEDVFPKDMLLEGYSPQKQQALYSFKRSYNGTEKLLNVKKNLCEKKNEVDSIETLLRKNYSNLRNLKEVLIGAQGAGEEDDNCMRSAIKNQSESIQKQERQLQKTREELKQVEASLGPLYSQFFREFEKQWNSMQEFKQKAGIPPEIDFCVGEDEPPVVKAGVEVSKNGKPLLEVTKGIFKGFGGSHQTPPRHHKHQYKVSSRSKSEMNSNNVQVPVIHPDISQLNYQSPVAHTSRSCNNAQHSRGLSSSRRRSISSTRGSQAPTNTPRFERSSRPSPRTKPAQYSQPAAYHQASKRNVPSTSSKISTGSPPPPPTCVSTTPLQFLHHPQYQQFPSEFFTESFAEYYTPEQDGSPEDYNESSIKHMLTGDPVVDSEILNFFSRRKAVFKQITEKQNNTKHGGSANNSHLEYSGPKYDSRNNYDQYDPSEMGAPSFIPYD